MVSANVLTPEQKAEEWARPLAFEASQESSNISDPSKDDINDEEDDLPSD